jgi:WD40 repeat protein
MSVFVFEMELNITAHRYYRCCYLLYRTEQKREYMKYLVRLPIMLVLAASSLFIDACSFKAEILSTPVSPPTSTQTFVPPIETPVPPTSILPTATPTLISIREGTEYMLENFMTVTEDEDVRSLAFSPDGTVLAASGGNADDFAIHLWDVATGQLVGVLGGHTDIVWGLAFSPDGEMLASVSRDHVAIIYDWRNAEIIKVLNFPGEVVSVSFSPDGQILAIGGVDEPQGQVSSAAVWTYFVGSWEPLIKFPEYINVVTMAYSPEGGTLVGGGASRNVQVWRTSDGTSVFTLNHAHQVSKVAISPDGSTVATGTCMEIVNDECSDGGIWLWDLPTGKLIGKLNGFPNIVENLAFSADGSLLISGSRDGTLRIYTTSNYETTFETNVSGGISAISLSADSGMLATGNLSGDVLFWKNVNRP